VLLSIDDYPVRLGDHLLHGAIETLGTLGKGKQEHSYDHSHTGAYEESADNRSNHIGGAKDDKNQAREDPEPGTTHRGGQGRPTVANFSRHALHQGHIRAHNREGPGRDPLRHQRVHQVLGFRVLGKRREGFPFRNSESSICLTSPEAIGLTHPTILTPSRLRLGTNAS